MSDRYGKQAAILGPGGQERLGRSSVLIAGIGALGGTISNLMVRAGVGRALLVDRDRAELGNLHRQLHLDEEDVARRVFKAEAAERRLRAANGQVRIEARVATISRENIDELMSGVDLVFDALDNIATRLLINDAAIRNAKPWIHCGVAGSRGNLLLIIPGQTPCMRCLYPGLEAGDDIPWVDSTGVLGTTAAFAAVLAADEALKYLSGNTESLARGMIKFDLWENEFEVIPLRAPTGDCACHAPG